MRFWPKMTIYWHVRPNLGKMRIFLKKKGSAIFLPLLAPNFMPSFGKILGAVSEINCVTDGRKNERTDKGDIIEPVASLVQKIYVFFSPANLKAN